MTTTNETRCKRCNFFGHKEADCRTKMCIVCDKKGHTARRQCKRCGRKGHVEETCRVPVCNHCQRLGHVEATCFRRECKRCGRKGHMEDGCAEEIWCSFCRVKNSHPTKQCVELQRYECSLCGEKGHTPRRCNSPYIYRGN